MAASTAHRVRAGARFTSPARNRLHSTYPGGGPVYFVRQEQVAQHRAGLVDHFAGGLIQNGIAGHIGGQYIRGELNPAALQTHDFGEGQSHGGFAYTGDIFQKNVASGQHGCQNPQQYGILAHDDLPHLVDQLLGAEGYLIFLIGHSNASFVYIIFLYYTWGWSRTQGKGVGIKKSLGVFP